jgi:DNA end-binding protein Ku
MSDLLAALQQSVEAARGKGDPGSEKAGSETSGKGKARSRTTGKKTAGKERKGDTDLESATKSQLLERARELDVSGRSSMSRDQLADAVRKAS